MQFSTAPEVKDIARDLIVNYHSYLLNARIEFVFCDPPAKSRGTEVWGSARKITGLAAFLASDNMLANSDERESFFVVTIAKEIWKQLNEKQRRALVDHELCHLWVDEDGELKLIGHDLEEFGAVVSRHGLWREDITRFLVAQDSLALFQEK